MNELVIIKSSFHQHTPVSKIPKQTDQARLLIHNVEAIIGRGKRKLSNYKKKLRGWQSFKMNILVICSRMMECPHNWISMKWSRGLVLQLLSDWIISRSSMLLSPVGSIYKLHDIGRLSNLFWQAKYHNQRLIEQNDKEHMIFSLRMVFTFSCISP